MTQRTYQVLNFRANVVNLPPVPVPLDITHDETAPDNRVSVLRRVSAKPKVTPTVTPEQMRAILRWMRENGE